MRIIQLIDSLVSGGAERMTVNISNVLVKDGHDVVLVVSRQLGNLKDFILPGITLRLLNKTFFFDIVAFNKWIKIILNFKPDVIHAHSSSVVWAILAKIIIRHKFHLVFHDHYGYGDELKDNDRRVLRWMSSKIDKVITVNDHLRQWNIANLDVIASHVMYINNFPYLREIERDKTVGAINILCLANLRPQKDHITLINAFSLLVKKHDTKYINLILAGIGFGDTYQKQISDLIEECGIENRVIFRGSVNQVEPLLAATDIGVLSSVSEGLPVSLLEYGLAGLPVVVTNVGQCSEVVGHGKFGIVVPPKDPEAMAKAMEDLLINPEKASEMGASFYKHITENYGPAKFLERYYHLLNA